MSGIHTRAVHAAQRDPLDLPVPPLVANAAILLDSVEQGWAQLTDETVENVAYQRYGSPTVLLLEEKFRQLEGARHTLSFNSGMTACYAIFRALAGSGDHIVAQHALYHEISDQLAADVAACGVDVTFVDDYEVPSFVEAMTERTRLVFVESPTNPALLDVDIPQLAAACTARGVLLVVDNTFLTPIYQRPLDLGAHLTIYSTTKTINGHGDAMGGLVSTNDDDVYARLKTHREYTGSILDPFSSWLTVRGLRTLPLRLERHSANAAVVVAHLRSYHPEYPVRTALETEHARDNVVTGATGVFSLVLASKEQGTRFIRSVRLARIGTTFGNLETLVYHFGTFARPTRDLSRIGLDYGLVRMSVGIEDTEDVIADVEQALERSTEVAATT